MWARKALSGEGSAAGGAAAAPEAVEPYMGVSSAGCAGAGAGGGVMLGLLSIKRKKLKVVVLLTRCKVTTTSAQ